MPHRFLCGIGRVATSRPCRGFRPKIGFLTLVLVYPTFGPSEEAETRENSISNQYGGGLIRPVKRETLSGLPMTSGRQDGQMTLESVGQPQKFGA